MVEPIPLALDAPVPKHLPTKISKAEIRSSLCASTLDGVFATIFSSITGGVLLSNFLVELQATSFQIGMLASIPLLANLLQPLGAYWADRSTSRRRYSLLVHGTSRLFWLPLAIAIMLFCWHPILPQQMIFATLAVLSITHVLAAIGSASWLSWLAVLVPRQLRGRYFGFRNSTFSLTSLIALPLLGFTVSHWPGGSLQGFGVMIIVAVVAGLASLGFQARMVDINPQVYWAKAFKVTAPEAKPEVVESSNGAIAQLDETNNVANAVPTYSTSEKAHHSMLNNGCFLLFLLYLGFWAFGMNLSNPFFNLYLLDNLAFDVSLVTVYTSLGAGANLLMLLFWGKLADRIGNRAILLLDGLLVALIPLLWLGTNATSISIWLWFPLLHLFGGGTGAAIDLCINNIQLEIAPVQHHTKYFAITAAVGGVAGAMGALVGGWLAQFAEAGGITGVFALSTVLRLIALLPLVCLQEPQRRSLRQMLQRLTQPTYSWFFKTRVEATNKI